MSIQEAQCLILKNIALFEDVIREYNEKIGPEIYSQIDEITDDFVESNEWVGEFDFWNTEPFWFASSSWRLNDTEDTDDFIAWYQFCFVKDSKTTSDNGYLFHLSPMLGIGSTQAGFSFEVARKNIGNPKASEWKKFCQNHRHNSELSRKGFVLLNSGNWFVSFKLDCKSLAESFSSGTVVDALQPIVDVLQKIKESHLLFEQLLADAQVEFNRIK